MNLAALPAFTDNYIWMLHDGAQAIVVDPGEAAPVLEALESQHLRLAGILVTHHHGDHVGGLADLRPVLQGPIYGPAHENIPEPCTPLEHGESVEMLGLRFEVIDVPGHTAGHIAYFHAGSAGGERPIVFCGDTLFSGGCGRLFEGTPAQMHASLSRLAALPGDTRVCCAHEYTLSNLKFANAVEPSNTALREYTAHCEALRADGVPTLPGSIETERRINPFLRCEAAEVVQSARLRGAVNDTPIEVFATLRQWKNEFR